MVLEGLGYVVTLGLATATIAGWPPHRSYWAIAALVTLAGAIPVVLSIVTWRSPGALDNASGVATIMAAARQVGSDTDVGVLITDAEELGLAGARAWAAERRGMPGDEAVLNCDGVDDAGGIVAMYSYAPPARLLGALARAAQRTGIAHEPTRMIPGVLTDSVAFTDRGFMSVTFSRGTWRSLARVHTRRDDLEHLRGTGIAETATLIAATVREMTGEEMR
jgi:Zn-dependent M28 family amino/carboxypeptidase